jgi:hypothetical protein
MAFEIKPDRYFIGMWHYPLPPLLSEYGKGGNVCCMVWRDPGMPPDTWTLQFRFRHYKDDRVFEHSDKMSWYIGTLNGAEADIEKRVGIVYNIQTIAAGSTLDFYPLHCTGDEALTKFQEKPPYWMHIQQALAE